MADEPKTEAPLLHIYPQPGYHEEAWITGNRSGLIALRDAINRTLETGKTEGGRVEPADGENYMVMVVPATPEMMEELKLPYYSGETRWKGTHPYQHVDLEDHRRLMG